MTANSYKFSSMIFLDKQTGYVNLLQDQIREVPPFEITLKNLGLETGSYFYEAIEVLVMRKDSSRKEII